MTFEKTYYDLSKHLKETGFLTPDTYGNEFGFARDIPAVYIFLCADKEMLGLKEAGGIVGYVGMSMKLRQRWCGHPILREIPDMFWVQRWFKPTPEKMLRDVERDLIQKFNPPWNIAGRRRGVM